MNLQEAFNKVWDWFITQKHGPSYVKGEGCKYRSGDGNKCAIGCLIKDEDYKKEMEFRRVHGLKIHGLLPEYLCKINIYKLATLQGIHDSYLPTDGPFPEYMKTALERFATENSLQIPTK